MLCNPRTPASVLRSQRNVTLPTPAVAADGAGRDGMLTMAILGGRQLATTAFSEGDTGLRAALLHS